MGSIAMNSSNTTEGAYVNSEMYTTNLETYKEIIIADFGSSHILTYRNYLANATTDGYESNGGWYDSAINLMNEIMICGSNIYHNIEHGTAVSKNTTIDLSQLALFRLDKSKIVAFNDSNGRTSYWLRDISSSAAFVNVGAYGYMAYSNASESSGVRPAFSIY